MTRETLRARVLTHLFDDPTAPTYWTTDEIDAFLQEAVEIFAEEVQAFRRTVYVPKRDGEQWYDLLAFDPYAMMPYRLWDHTAQERLVPTTMRRLNEDRYRWLGTTDTQQRWWYPISWGRFGVHPGLAAGGGLLRVDYLAWPLPLMDDGDILEGPEADEDGLLAYAEYLGLLSQWEGVRALERFAVASAQWRESQARQTLSRWAAREPQRQRGESP